MSHPQPPLEEEKANNLRSEVSRVSMWPGRTAAARAQMNAHSGQLPAITAFIGICNPQHMWWKKRINNSCTVEPGINEQKKHLVDINIVEYLEHVKGPKRI